MVVVVVVVGVVVVVVVVGGGGGGGGGGIRRGGGGGGGFVRGRSDNMCVQPVAPVGFLRGLLVDPGPYVAWANLIYSGSLDVMNPV